MKKLTRFQLRIIRGKTCPYCKGKTELIDSVKVYGRSYGMMYMCWGCKAYVGTHKGTKNALGRLANKELRKWKNRAHAEFDKLWEGKMGKRSKAYRWLSNKLKIPHIYTHIGMFGVKTCKRVVIEVKKKLNTFHIDCSCGDQRKLIYSRPEGFHYACNCGSSMWVPNQII
ncbi:MAG: hypothetical protein GWP15_03115 [Nitrospirae bacterium]|nr:hypothetical protein [Nitrospirota bacterium]